MQKKDGSWVQISYKTDGRYACIDDIDFDMISIIKVYDYSLFYLIVILLAAFNVGAYFIVKKKKTK